MKDAIKFLEAHHEKVKKLLNELTETTPCADEKRARLLKKIEQELKIHTHIEEAIFYPAFKKAGNTKEATGYIESLVEHRAVSMLVLPDLKKTDPTSAKFLGRASVLKDMFGHYADEEESIIFKKAEESLSADVLKLLGKQMNERKKALQAKIDQ